MSPKAEQMLELLEYLAAHPNANTTPAVQENVDIPEELIAPVRSRVRRSARFVARKRKGNPTPSNAETPDFPNLTEDAKQIADILDFLVSNPRDSVAEIVEATGADEEIAQRVHTLVRTAGENE